MSVIKFELTKEHLDLIRCLTFTYSNNKIAFATHGNSPFGGDDLYVDMDLILNGDHSGKKYDAEFNRVFDEKIEKYFDELYQALPSALEIIMGLQTFEPGVYKKKHYENGFWTKSNKK